MTLEERSCDLIVIDLHQERNLSIVGQEIQIEYLNYLSLINKSCNLINGRKGDDSEEDSIKRGSNKDGSNKDGSNKDGSNKDGSKDGSNKRSGNKYGSNKKIVMGKSNNKFIKHICI